MSIDESGTLARTLSIRAFEMGFAPRRADQNSRPRTECNDLNLDLFQSSGDMIRLEISWVVDGMDTIF